MTNHILLCVFSVVIWTVSGMGVPQASNQISTEQPITPPGTDTGTPTGTTETEPTHPSVTPTITTPYGCVYDGKTYKPGEYIQDEPCYFIQCDIDGQIIGSRMTCDDNENQCNFDGPAYRCCSICTTASTTTTTLERNDSEQPTTTTKGETDPPTTTPNGCYENGQYYEPGEYIENEPCYFTQCTEGGVLLAGDYFCEDFDNQCNYDFPNQCCSLCTTTTLQSLTTTATYTEKQPETPERAPTSPPYGCWEDGKFYQPGTIIQSGPCGSVECNEQGDIIYGDIFCDDSENQCNTDTPPNDCCPVCQSSPTTTETTTAAAETTAGTTAPANTSEVTQNKTTRIPEDRKGRVGKPKRNPRQRGRFQRYRRYRVSLRSGGQRKRKNNN